MPFDDSEDLRDETAMRQLDQRFPMDQMTGGAQQQSIGQRILAMGARQPRALDLSAASQQFQPTPSANRSWSGPGSLNEVQDRLPLARLGLLQTGSSTASPMLAQQSSTPSVPAPGRVIGQAQTTQQTQNQRLPNRQSQNRPPKNQQPPINTLDEQLRRDEGFRETPYRDTTGRWTIGYGHNLDAQNEQRPDRISREQAETILQRDIQEANRQLDQNLPWARDLDPARRAVLANMVFNIWIGNAPRNGQPGSGLLGFQRALDAVRNGDYEGASREMLGSRWSGQVGDRATRLAEQMRTGNWR
jgi:lysozyme